MAKVLGKSGRYVSERATKLQHWIWTLCIICMAVIGTILGFILRASVPWFTFRPSTGILLSAVLILVLYLVASWTFRRIEALRKDRDKWRQGARGEEVVGVILKELPDEYHVINDFPTDAGNLDHVVIGPTGVFVLETKSWRGVIDADEQGELTQNGKAATSAHVSGFTARMMGVRKKILVLATGRETFFQGVMVFTRAWVEASYGTTRQVHCVRDDKLVEYLTDEEWSRKLKADEVEDIAVAFTTLAKSNAERKGEMMVDGEEERQAPETGGQACVTEGGA